MDGALSPLSLSEMQSKLMVPQSITGMLELHGVVQGAPSQCLYSLSFHAGAATVTSPIW